ncbi:MAG: hypothetical protein AAFN08_14990 [Cyanobacteria bacterium J06559_3]
MTLNERLNRIAEQQEINAQQIAHNAEAISTLRADSADLNRRFNAFIEQAEHDRQQMQEMFEQAERDRQQMQANTEIMRAMLAQIATNSTRIVALETS